MPLKIRKPQTFSAWFHLAIGILFLALVVYSIWSAYQVIRGAGPGLRTGDPVTVMHGKICKASTCEDALMVDGPIQLDFVQQFQIQIDKLPNAGWMCFNSPGGNTKTALIAAVAIANAGLKTCVVPYERPNGLVENTSCDSACNLVFLAGNERIIAQSARVRLHSARICDVAGCGLANWLASTLTTVELRLLGWWFGKGHEYQALDEAMRATPWQQAHSVTAEEFTRWGVGPAQNFGSDWRFIADR